MTYAQLLTLLPFVTASAPAPAAVPCFSGKASCPSMFGMNHSGCCALDDPEAVCCQTVLVGPTGPIVPGNEGLKRSYCCPSGSKCTERGCTVPVPAPRLCGPTQGDNCNVSYLCSSGPPDWTYAAESKPAVLVVGDSVSNGWTPVLAQNLIDTHAVAHSPGQMADGGARSTSNFVNCHGYLLSTDTLDPLPLTKGDAILINFGLHDYNLGLAGVPEYTSEYRTGLTKAKAIAAAAAASITILATTPAHNTATPADDLTVVALNKAAAALATEFGFHFIDLYHPLTAKCGPVPWADNGTNACSLCAPNCKSLSVHYSHAGYEVIAGLIQGGMQRLGLLR